MRHQFIIGILVSCGILGTTHDTRGKEPAAQKVRPKATTVLLAHDARCSTSLKVFQPNPAKPYARFYVGNWREPDQSFEWRIEVAEAGKYEVAIVSEGASAVKVGVKDSRVEETIANREWNRTRLGELSLPKGAHMLRLALREKLAQEGKLRAIELTPVAAKADIARRVGTQRADTQWFQKSKYGVMFQWGEWGFPINGPAKKWPAMIDDFDVERFAKMVAEETGAGYVIWSITWRGSRISAPLKSVEKIVPGYTTKRDLIGDLARALEKRGIKLMLYYHPRHEDDRWWKANWKSSADTQRFVDNWVAVVSEIGERYGDKLAGWFFDDGILYPSEHFERFAGAAKAGHKGRLVAWNSWILPSVTDFQDVHFGEGWRDNAFPPIRDRGLWSSGPHKGLQAHTMFMADGPDWGIWKANTRIEPLITPEEAVKRVGLGVKHGHVVTINLQMYEDGSVSPRSLQALQAVRDAFRKKSNRVGRLFGMESSRPPFPSGVSGGGVLGTSDAGKPCLAHQSRDV